MLLFNSGSRQCDSQVGNCCAGCECTDAVDGLWNAQGYHRSLEQILCVLFCKQFQYFFVDVVWLIKCQSDQPQKQNSYRQNHLPHLSAADNQLSVKPFRIQLPFKRHQILNRGIWSTKFIIHPISKENTASDKNIIRVFIVFVAEQNRC